MLSFDALSKIEALLMSKTHPLWGEFMQLAQVLSEVQREKQAIEANMRAQPTVSNGAAAQANTQTGLA
jgi:hypothetical protein